MFGPALGAKPLPRGYFGRGLPALHHHAFSFSCIHVVSEKKIFFKNWSILTCFAPHHRPQGTGNPKFKIYVPLVPKMRHIKFGKKWSSGNVWPRPGGKTSTPRTMKFTILVKAFLLYITMPSDFFFK
jgi:hypothetical protein